MKTATINIYKFEELSEGTQQHIYDTWRNNDVMPWSDENRQTLEAFTEIFPVQIKDWEYGYHNYINWDFIGDDDIEQLYGTRLLKYFVNNYWNNLWKGKYYSTAGHWDKNKKFHYRFRHSKCQFEHCCVLTGYCMDDDILQPIYGFMKQPDGRNFYDIMNECLNAWVESCRVDYECHLSPESIKEDIEANEYDFTEDGEIY